jgi:hypothetical protein
VRVARSSGIGGARTMSDLTPRGVKNLNHPVVGELNLIFEGADLMADPGLNLHIYTAEPGSRTGEALQLLASWALTQEREKRRRTVAARSRNRGRAAALTHPPPAHSARLRAHPDARSHPVRHAPILADVLPCGSVSAPGVTMSP